MAENYEPIECLPQGIPTIESYSKLLKSPVFLEMEKFSNQFLELNKHILTEYNRKWVSDPLHQWSRQWEYPFVYTGIYDYVNKQPENKRIIRILDAGSGATFFPYYIGSTFDHVKVDCLDIDDSLESVFSELNANSTFSTDFYSGDIHSMPFVDNSYDVVYGISVLEHTEDFEAIVQEFKRVLKQTGLLIVTFDISIDGAADISINGAAELIKTIEKYFRPVDNFEYRQALEFVNDERILTTKYIRKIDENLLPWKCTHLSAFKNILKFRRRGGFSNLTLFCGLFINE